MTTINIKEEFNQYIGGRYRTLGKHSAEELRDDIVIPALKKYKDVTLDFDDVIICSSALEELCGGIVRNYDMPGFYLKNTLYIECDTDSTLVDEAWEYIHDAQDCKRAEEVNTLFTAMSLANIQLSRKVLNTSIDTLPWDLEEYITHVHKWGYVEDGHVFMDLDSTLTKSGRKEKFNVTDGKLWEGLYE